MWKEEISRLPLEMTLFTGFPAEMTPRGPAILWPRCLSACRSSDQPRDVVFHNGFVALIFYPVPISDDAAAAIGYRFRVEDFDFDLNRVAALHRPEQAHFVDADERHSRSVNNPGLNGQPF